MITTQKTKLTYRMRAWTGPICVQDMASRLQEAGVRVLHAGTEHVLVEVRAFDAIDARLAISEALKQHHGTDYGLGFTPVFVVFTEERS